MPHGNDEARRCSTHIQEKRPKIDKELQTNHTTQQRLIQNITGNNPCWQTEKDMRGSDIQATEGICPWETNNRPHPPSVPHTRIRRQFRRRCTANIHVEATQRHVSGSNTRKCMHLRGSKVVWREFYTLPPHIYADYCPRDILLLAKQ